MPKRSWKRKSQAVVDQEESKRVIKQANRRDILCGYKKAYNHHPGNVLLREMIRAMFTLYDSLQVKQDKMLMTASIMKRMKDKYGSRFLSRNAGGHWEEISAAKARDKISHALRYVKRMAAKGRVRNGEFDNDDANIGAPEDRQQVAAQNSSPFDGATATARQQLFQRQSLQCNSNVEEPHQSTNGDVLNATARHICHNTEVTFVVAPLAGADPFVVPPDLQGIPKRAKVEQWSSLSLMSLVHTELEDSFKPSQELSDTEGFDLVNPQSNAELEESSLERSFAACIGIDALPGGHSDRQHVFAPQPSLFDATARQNLFQQQSLQRNSTVDEPHQSGLEDLSHVAAGHICHNTEAPTTVAPSPEDVHGNPKRADVEYLSSLMSVMSLVRAELEDGSQELNVGKEHNRFNPRWSPDFEEFRHEQERSVANSLGMGGMAGACSAFEAPEAEEDRQHVFAPQISPFDATMRRRLFQQQSLQGNSDVDEPHQPGVEDLSNAPARNICRNTEAAVVAVAHLEGEPHGDLNVSDFALFRSNSLMSAEFENASTTNPPQDLQVHRDHPLDYPQRIAELEESRWERSAATGANMGGLAAGEDHQQLFGHRPSLFDATARRQKLFQQQSLQCSSNVEEPDQFRLKDVSIAAASNMYRKTEGPFIGAAVPPLPGELHPNPEEADFALFSISSLSSRELEGVSTGRSPQDSNVHKDRENEEEPRQSRDLEKLCRTIAHKTGMNADMGSMAEA